MEITWFVNGMFALEAGTVVKILLWGNLVMGLLVSVYRSSHGSEEQDSNLRYFIGSKLCQSLAWACVISAGFAPPLVSVNLGFSLLFIGLFAESRVILGLTGSHPEILYRFQLAILAACLVSFNVFEFTGDRVDPRMSLAFFFIMVIFLFPGLGCLFEAERSRLMAMIGALYLLFFLLSALRGVEIFFRMRIVSLDGRALEGMIFLVFILILFVGGTGVLLLIKEKDDRKIRELAYLDHLTGLLNRRHFLEEATIAFERHARYREELALLFLDLDHFKMVNDTYGHAFGDEVLRDFASLLRTSVRTSDLCCRYGGEEFVLLLSNTSRFRALAVVRRLQSAIAQSSFKLHPSFSYTTSVGLHAAVPRVLPGDTLEAFIEKGDKALYRAKESGRNCVVTYED